MPGYSLYALGGNTQKFLGDVIMKEQNEKYSYTYNASQNSEIDKIVEKYREKTPTETAAEQIKKLDGAVEKKASAAAIIIGIIGALLLGVGMCCTTVWQGLFVLGIIVGVIGMIVLACAYPVYSAIAARKRKKIAASILELSESLK